MPDRPRLQSLLMIAAPAVPDDAPRTLSVSGQGAKPSRRPTSPGSLTACRCVPRLAGDAMRMTSDAMAEVFASLDAQGIDLADVRPAASASIRSGMTIPTSVWPAGRGRLRRGQHGDGPFARDVERSGPWSTHWSWRARTGSRTSVLRLTSRNRCSRRRGAQPSPTRGPRPSCWRGAAGGAPWAGALSLNESVGYRSQPMSSYPADMARCDARRRGHDVPQRAGSDGLRHRVSRAQAVAVASAWSRSAIRSSASSIPMDTRTTSGRGTRSDLLLGGQLAVGRRGRVDDQRAGVAEIGDMAEELDGIHQFHASIVTALSPRR